MLSFLNFKIVYSVFTPDYIECVCKITKNNWNTQARTYKECKKSLKKQFFYKKNQFLYAYIRKKQ